MSESWLSEIRQRVEQAHAVAQATREKRPSPVDWPHDWAYADDIAALLPVVEAVVRQRKARARADKTGPWDEEAYARTTHDIDDAYQQISVALAPLLQPKEPTTK